ncbi:S-adenosyl-L-methionine-dependent methyltransferase [Truncatella angustata]|uniref:S-adenosyl-L-methionine-dependent methyltransferase n=1 Tax=Truncatella angustata TaxID=152316 RepID=A0A9P8UCD1_9PEZI|nr:S-adenosyl-L-methionine-dependent methyltransferase [Truncatella angustata]KAH6646055.1 S-adenosyl-L-methionine-dependent methyltransferase [Truncatella angustata]
MSSSLYTLNHDNPVEINRLDQNHYNLYLKLQGGHVVPPHIRDHLERVNNPRVADVGTGTGVFLRSLAERLPATARLDGFDPDTSKFPDPSTLPPNIKLEYGDALAPFPKELVGSYDLVHLRLQFFSWQKDGWPKVVENMMNLLKPGGWLLWFEGGWHGWTTIPPSKAFHEYLGREIERTMKLGREPLACFKLKNWFKDAGFQEVDERIFNILQDEVLHKVGANVLYTVCHHSALGVAEQGDTEGLKDKKYVEDLFKQIRKDFETSLVSQEFRWVWGRKPLGERQQYKL